MSFEKPDSNENKNKKHAENKWRFEILSGLQSTQEELDKILQEYIDTFSEEKQKEFDGVEGKLKAFFEILEKDEIWKGKILDLWDKALEDPRFNITAEYIELDPLIRGDHTNKTEETKEGGKKKIKKQKESFSSEEEHIIEKMLSYNCECDIYKSNTGLEDCPGGVEMEECGRLREECFRRLGMK